jgi:hypothetical protein
MVGTMISNTVRAMRDFQEKNCIKSQCMTNAQYLYDIIKHNSSRNVKVKPVIVVSIDYETETTTCVGGHLIVELDDDTILEPSYDVFSLKNKSYFDNIKSLMDSYENELKIISELKSILKESISLFITFVKIAEQINNGELLINDKEFYDNQADYIESFVI